MYRFYDDTRIPSYTIPAAEDTSGFYYVCKMALHGVDTNETKYSIAHVASSECRHVVNLYEVIAPDYKTAIMSVSNPIRPTITFTEEPAIVDSQTLRVYEGAKMMLRIPYIVQRGTLDIDVCIDASTITDALLDAVPDTYTYMDGIQEITIREDDAIFNLPHYQVYLMGVEKKKEKM